MLAHAIGPDLVQAACLSGDTKSPGLKLAKEKGWHYFGTSALIQIEFFQK